MPSAPTDGMPKTVPAFEFNRTSYNPPPKLARPGGAKVSPQMPPSASMMPTNPGPYGAPSGMDRMQRLPYNPPPIQRQPPPNQHPSGPHPSAPRQGNRPGYFVNDPQRESEISGPPANASPGARVDGHGHHHHRHSLTNSGGAKSPPQQPPRMDGPLPSISGWAPPPLHAPPPSALHGPPADLKRKRSNMDEGGQPHRHHHHVHHVHPSQPSPMVDHPSYAPPYPSQQPPPIKKAEHPIFTDQDILVNVRDPFPHAHTKSVAQVLSRPDVEAGQSRFLGQFVWNPQMDASKLLDGRVLSSNIGARLKVVVDARWLSVPFALPSDPATTYKVEKDGQNDWELWDLDPFAQRKVWGSMIYTDDSDPLVAAVHSGALLIYPSTMQATKTGKPGTRLSILVRVLPKLVNYQGTPRSGVDSRSWGNSHDGVSLYIERVDLVEVSMRRAQWRGIDTRHRTMRRVRIGGKPWASHRTRTLGRCRCLSTAASGGGFAGRVSRAI
jgi:hypothetical protein